MSSNGNGKLRFGNFQLDLAKRVVWHKEEPLPLPLKALDLLSLLVERKGDVVTKDEIWEKVWNGAFVEETNLTHNIYVLRKTFRDLGVRNLIETVPRRGYRFTGVVEEQRSGTIVYERATITDTFVEEVTLSDATPLSQLFARKYLLATGVSAIVLIGALALFLMAPGQIAALRSNNNGEVRSSIPKGHWASLDAYRLYERGRFEWSKRSTSGMIEAQRLFREAIEIDPNFALAYSGLADTVATASRWDEARALVARSLELGPHLAEVHASDGFVKMFGLRQWDDAQEAFLRSTDMDPNYATARHWYATLLSIRGRNDEAKLEMQKAITINPVSPNFLTDMGKLHYYSGEYDLAREYCRRALALDANFLFAHETLYYIGLKTGNYHEAIESLMKADQINREPGSTAAQDKAHETQSRRLRSLLRKGGLTGFLQAKYPDSSEPDTFYFSAMKYALLGDNEKALFFLDKAADTRSFLSVFSRANPLFEPLRVDPRYHAILAKMKLAD